MVTVREVFLIGNNMGDLYRWHREVVKAIKYILTSR